MVEGGAIYRPQLAILISPLDVQHTAPFGLKVLQVETVQTLSQRGVAHHDTRAVIAIVVDHDSTIDLQDGPVVGLK